MRQKYETTNAVEGKVGLSHFNRQYMSSEKRIVNEFAIIIFAGVTVRDLCKFTERGS